MDKGSDAQSRQGPGTTAQRAPIRWGTGAALGAPTGTCLAGGRWDLRCRWPMGRTPLSEQK